MVGGPAGWKVSHHEGAVKRAGPWGEEGRIVENAGADFGSHGLRGPAGALQAHTVVEGFEQLADESIRRGGGDRKLYLAVAGGDVDVHLAAVFVDPEAGGPVAAGEDFASSGRGDPGVSVTPGDVYADLCAVGVVPFDREAVGGVLGDNRGTRGRWPARRSPRRMKHTPPTARPETSCGRNGHGRNRATSSGLIR